MNNRRLRELLDGLFGLLWPVDCLCCGAAVDRPGLCATCGEMTEPRGSPRCAECDADLEPPEVARCSRCVERAGALERTWGLFDYAGPIGEVVRVSKYNGRLDGPPFLRRVVSAAIPLELEQDRPEAVVPVASHSARVRRRSVDLPLVLACGVGSGLRVPVQPRWLRRTRDTPAQAGLDEAARRRNVRGAFLASPRVRGVDVLLVDDVRTTGATLEEAARALRRAGASRVRAVALALVSRPR